MSKSVVIAGWNDVPHLDDAEKADLLGSYPAYQRDARTKGIPMLGSGAIYPIAEENILVDDFPVPLFWPMAYGMDVGWKRTASLWGAVDREKDILYLTGEYYRAHAEPEVHTASIKLRGDWIPGAIDPASRGRSQNDGVKLLDEYRRLGLKLHEAENAVEAGIFACYQRMTTGRLRVFKSLASWLFEYRIYRRDEKGKVVKENDHLMDSMRYLVMTGMSIARNRPVEQVQGPPKYDPMNHW